MQATGSGGGCARSGSLRGLRWTSRSQSAAFLESGPVDGRLSERLVYRGEEDACDFLEAGRAYAIDADGSLLRLPSEVYRPRSAQLFDPYLAVSAPQNLADTCHSARRPTRGKAGRPLELAERVSAIIKSTTVHRRSGTFI